MTRAALALAALVAGCGNAVADGYPPFYGYSRYFGGPATYFSHNDDVQQATRMRDGDLGFGTTTYYRGGPFYYYRQTPPRAYYPRHRHRVVLRRRG